MTIESYLQRAWSDAIDNPTMHDITIAIAETKEMNEEHEAFWVGIFDGNEHI